MKEFDYEKAKAGAPVCTRDGRPARIICWDANAKWDDDKFPIVALIDDDVDGEVAQTYTTDGRMYPPEVRDDDLMMATVKHEGWINIHKTDCGYEPSALVHISEYLAKVAADGNKDYITTVKIEWEE